MIKEYFGIIPPCGVFCGGCPVYIRDSKPCPGAEISKRCESKNCSFYICCSEKWIEFCHQCSGYPCKRFKSFARRWQKYGQNFLENQETLKVSGKEIFLECWNSQANKGE
jgi:hypothetical protein